MLLLAKFAKIRYSYGMNIVLFTHDDNNFFPQNDERTKHILKVLHKKMGETFEAGIENGLSGIATITKIDETGLYFDFTATGEGKPLHNVEMIIGFVRPIQLKRLFRDMASLGVRKIHLVATELGEKSYMDSKIVERGTAYNALREGTIQAKSTHVPELCIHTSVENCIKSLNLENGIKVCLDNIEPKTTLFSFLGQKNAEFTQNSTIFAAIGSERGWSFKERMLFEENKFTLCSMGNRVLRTETASTVAVSLMLQAKGEL